MRAAASQSCDRHEQDFVTLQRLGAPPLHILRYDTTYKNKGIVSPLQ